MLVSDVLWKIYDDDDMRNVFYQFEYGELRYSEVHHGSDNEKNVDKLMACLEILAKQYYLGLLTLEGIELITYEYITVYQDDEIKKHLISLDGWFEKRGIKNPPYEKFKKLGTLIEKNYFNQLQK